MEKLFMLCGVPGVGKSTWTKQFPRHNVTVLSTDDILDDLAKKYQLTYNQLFGDVSYSFAEKMMHNIAEQVFKRRDPFVVWDQTNLTPKSRMKKLLMVPGDYIKTAVVFNIPFDHQVRLQRRAENTGKDIPVEVMDRMLASFERPTLSEGFNEVLEVTME